MNILLVLSIIFFLSLSIVLFDLDLVKKKNLSNKLRPYWVGFIYFVCIFSWIVILFINWKIAILGIVVYYISAFIKLPQIVGGFIMNPFKSKMEKNRK